MAWTLRAPSSSFKDYQTFACLFSSILPPTPGFFFSLLDYFTANSENFQYLKAVWNNSIWRYNALGAETAGCRLEGRAPCSPSSRKDSGLPPSGTCPQHPAQSQPHQQLPAGGTCILSLPHWPPASQRVQVTAAPGPSSTLLHDRYWKMEDLGKRKLTTWSSQNNTRTQNWQFRKTLFSL